VIHTPCRFARVGLAAVFTLALAAAPSAQSPVGGVTLEHLEQEINATFGLADSTVFEVSLDGVMGGAVTAALELQGQSTLMHLLPVSVRGQGFQVLTQQRDGSLVAQEAAPSSTLRGALLDIPGSRVAASWLDEGLFARILMADGVEYWLEPIAAEVDGALPGHHVLYAGSDVLDHGKRCGSDLLPDVGVSPLPQSGGGQVYEGTAVQVAELACDADYEYFQDYGTVGATTNRIESVINTVNMQYEAEVGITHEITTIVVRTSSNDPYSSTDAGTLLNQFRNEWNSNQSGVQRDVAELFTGKEIQGGTIGIAWVGVVCNLGFAYNMVQSDFNGAFACATDLSAHELGHNWGADHCNCTSNTMNPFITCANTFSAQFSVPDITSYRDSVNCLEGGGTPPGGDPVSLHVASIVPSTVKKGQGKKSARATVVIEDDQGNPVSGVTVTVTFTGHINEVGSGTTNGSGSVAITTNGTKKGKLNFTACVTGVSGGGLPYDSGDNVETCDSK